MELIIDKLFLYNLFFITETNDETLQDFLTYLKRVKYFKLKINYKSLEEAEVESNPIFEYLINEYVPTIYYDTELTNKLKDKDFYENGQSFKLFFIEKSNKECAELSEKFGYEYINSNSVVNKWKLYRNDSSLKVTKNSDYPLELKLKDWNKLEFFKHPLNSIIVCDRYILVDKYRQKIDENLIVILEILLSCKNVSENVDVMILSQEILSSNSSSLKDKLVRVHSRIQSKLSKLKKKINLNIILFDSNFENYGSYEKIHDRRIYTNYFRMSSGPGFNLFHKNGNTVESFHETDFEVKFIFKYQNYLKTKNELMNINQYLKNIRNRTNRSERENYIYVNGTNRLLKT